MPTAFDTVAELRHDDKGRPIAEDGYPISGLAHVKEVAAACGTVN